MNIYGKSYTVNVEALRDIEQLIGINVNSINDRGGYEMEFFPVSELSNHLLPVLYETTYYNGSYLRTGLIIVFEGDGVVRAMIQSEEHTFDSHCDPKTFKATTTKEAFNNWLYKSTRKTCDF
jgi:hypothetical protein